MINFEEKWEAAKRFVPAVNPIIGNRYKVKILKRTKVIKGKNNNFFLVVKTQVENGVSKGKFIDSFISTANTFDEIKTGELNIIWKYEEAIDSFQLRKITNYEPELFLKYIRESIINQSIIVVAKEGELYKNHQNFTFSGYEISKI